MQVSSSDDLKLLEAISTIKGFEANEENKYVCILFDLMLYRCKELQAKAFNLLVNYFTRKRILIECLRTTQILESTSSIRVMIDIKKSAAILEELQTDISFWLLNHKPAGTEAKEKVI